MTLVHPLQCTEPKPSARIASAEGLPPILRRFQAAVDEAVPGMYAWFARESLHVTIQGLIG